MQNIPRTHDRKSQNSHSLERIGQSSQLIRCLARALLAAAVMIALVGPPQRALADLTGTSVLLLGDGYSEGQVQPALEAAGYNVGYGGLYYAWDGVSPDIGNFDVVVYLDGYNYGHPMTPGGVAALTNFVAGGGGLILTEWIAYDAFFGDCSPEIAELVPVTTPDANYSAGGTWTVIDSRHPLAADLPANWFDDGAYSVVQARPGATVVVNGPNNNPGVTFSTQAGGTVVHINHAMLYALPTISEQALTMLVNAAAFADPCHVSDPVKVLLLGDGNAEAQVQPALEDACISVTFGGTYFEWDGVSPNINTFDVVVFLNGWFYDELMTPGGAAALAGFVAGGGGLVFTEWVAFSSYWGLCSPEVAALTPVISPNGGYDYGSTWTALDAGHPLVANMPPSWFDIGGFSYTQAKPGTTVVATGTDGVPVISFSTESGGTVVHLNHGLNEAPGAVTPTLLQLLVNAANFAATPLPNPCSADISSDDIVNVTDLLAVISAWGACPGCAADISGDDIVNVTDLLAVISAWGPCP
ncbi:MAG: hypothetical protein L0219_17820 [Phycisphaerales bacterium]|nr:hypothetical protein [Phycisphaerales bacterium]